MLTHLGTKKQSDSDSLKSQKNMTRLSSKQRKTL